MPISNEQKIRERTTHILPPEDVYNVRQYLLNWLPLELVYAIMDEARYWPTITSTARAGKFPWMFWETPYSEHADENSFCCVFTPRLPDWQDQYEAVRIRNIRFVMISHDQGETVDPGPFQTEYEGSFTCFEAVIARDFEDEVFPELHRLIQETAREASENAWEIQRNVRASPGFRIHRVTWSSRDEDSGSEGEVSYDLLTGSSKRAGFAQALLPGDRIAIIMRSKKRDWKNVAGFAEIGVNYSM